MLRNEHVYYHKGMDEYLFSEIDDMHEHDDNFLHVCKIEKKGKEFKIYKQLKENGEQNGSN